MADEHLPIAGEYIEMFSAMFSDHEVTLAPFDAYRMQLPETVDACDGYVISGSRSGAYDDKRWIGELMAFIREAVREDVPMVGVCFGHQVMAAALGGTVERFDGGWGGGVRTMTVTSSRPWMSGSPEKLSLIMSHDDQVTKLPDGANLIGSSDHCENFLVEFTPHHVGIQGHPEFSRPFAAAIYNGCRETRGAAADDALATLAHPTDASLVAGWIHNVIAGSE